MRTDRRKTRLAICVAAALVAAASAQAAVKVSDTGYVEKKQGGDVYVSRRIVLDTGARRFIIATNGSALGLVGTNWHSGELCTVFMNGERFYSFNARAGLKENFKEKTKFTVTPGRDAATIKAEQQGKKGKVTLILTARAGDDKLSLTVKVQPVQKLRSTIIGFECYPSAMSPRNKLTRAVSTAHRTDVLEPGANGKRFAVTKDEPWLFFYDKVYDLGVPTTGKGKGAGGCGLFYVPEETAYAWVMLGALHIDPRFAYGPNTTEMHFTILDFRNRKSNADAMEAMNALEDEGHVPGQAGPK